MLGFDIISLSSYSNKQVGREAHKAFLDHSYPILLLEDMDLSMIRDGMLLKQIIVSPVRIENTDGSPCTVLANISEWGYKFMQ